MAGGPDSGGGVAGERGAGALLPNARSRIMMGLSADTTPPPPPPPPPRWISPSCTRLESGEEVLALCPNRGLEPREDALS